MTDVQALAERAEQVAHLADVWHLIGAGCGFLCMAFGAVGIMYSNGLAQGAAAVMWGLIVVSFKVSNMHQRAHEQLSVQLLAVQVRQLGLSRSSRGD